MLARSLRRTLIPCVYLRTRRAAIGAHTSCIWRTGIKPASHASHASHAIAQAVPGGDPFSSWIAVNPLPGIDAAPQQVHEAESSAQDSPRLVTRRYHHTIASAVVHTLSQRYSRIQWSPDRKAFLFSAIPTASAAQGRASADASNVLPPQAQPSVSLKLPIVLQKHHSLSGTDGTELLQRVAAGTARPGRTLIALLTADSAALALWEVCNWKPSSMVHTSAHHDILHCGAMYTCTHGSRSASVKQDGELLRHKVLTGYTIRKQQGGSQLKHLRSGAGEAQPRHAPGSAKAVGLALLCPAGIKLKGRASDVQANNQPVEHSGHGRRAGSSCLLRTDYRSGAYACTFNWLQSRGQYLAIPWKTLHCAGTAGRTTYRPVNS